MMSTISSNSIEDVNEAYGEPTWYQRYARAEWENTSKLVKRVKAAGCPVLVFTSICWRGGGTRSRTSAARPSRAFTLPRSH